MMDVAPSFDDTVSPAGSRVTLELWLGVLLAPVGWALHLLVSYAVATVACDARIAVHLVTTAALAMAATGGIIAWRVGRHFGTPSESDPSRLGRRQFMRHSGLVLSALFTIVIAVQATPTFFLRPCE